MKLVLDTNVVIDWLVFDDAFLRVVSGGGSGAQCPGDYACAGGG